VSIKKIGKFGMMRDAMCNNGTDCVWNDELIAIFCEKRVSAHSIISCGVFSSNSSESLFIFCSDNMRALYRYNHCVNSDIAKQLINPNHKFYDQFGDSFSATRGRLQNGVIKILETIKEDESVLDLGCGNGLFLHTLSKRGHKSRLF